MMRGRVGWWLGLLAMGVGFGADLRAADRLSIAPGMVINESGWGDAGRLADEQDRIGDPLTRPGGGERPDRPYFAGWSRWVYPVHLVVDFGPGQKATTLATFHESGEGSIRVAGGTPTAWNPPQTLALTGYRRWVALDLDRPTRYLRITLDAPTSLPEVAAYGTRRPPADPPAPQPTRPAARPRPSRPSFDGFLGVNAFIDDPAERIIPVAGTVREYHDAGWDFEGADHRLRFQPSGAAGGNAWFFDDYYRRLVGRGVTVVPCVKGSLPWVTGSAETEARPARDGADPTDPASYREHAAHLFQLAGRYGGRRVADDLLTLAPGQPLASGLGLIRDFESGNEPDKDWKGRTGYSTPFELAAQLSADRDGHLGRLGPGVGLRAADPDARLVLTGLYRTPLVYLDAIRFWADYHRGGNFPADVLNVHIYCSDGDAQQAFRTQGISPEAGKLRERAAELVAWRDRHTPEAEVWVTEFGYDTHSASPLHAPRLGTLAPEVVQGAWLARSFLLLHAAGIERATMFMLRDVDGASAGVFNSSGLVSRKGEWTPKPAWNFQATLKAHLTSFGFESDVDSNRPDVKIIRLASGARSAFAVWCPTSEDHRVSGYRLPVLGARATRVELVSDRPDGRSSPLPVADGAVIVDLSEVPTLILVD